MKRNVFFILALAGFVWSCSTPETPKTTVLNYYTPYNGTPEYLNGQIKSVKEISYRAIEKDGSFEKGDELTSKELNELGWSVDYITTFDTDGNVVQTKYMLDDNKFNTWDVESHNGKIVKATFTRADTVHYYHEIEYIGLNEKISQYSMPNDELTITYNVEKGENGIYNNKVEWFNPENELLGYNLFKSDENGRILGYKRFNVQDSLTTSTELDYNDKGFFTKQTISDGGGSVSSSIDLQYLTYDELGNWLTSVGALNNGPKLIFERTYEYY